jgi:DNA-directed RNA polymerase specialized sigma24 family protein
VNRSQHQDIATLEDEELVARFLEAGDPDCGRILHESIVERYCEPLDTRIRAVLASRGLDYSPSSDYYNTLFFDIYERTLSPQGLRKKAAHFRSHKGRFRTWFLGAVVVNEVRDWLKRKNRPQALLMSEALGHETEFRLRRTESLEYLDRSLPFNRTKNETPPATETSGQLEDLSMEHRVVAYLVFLAYCDPPGEVIEAIARARDEPPREIESILRGIQTRLRELPQFGEGEKLEGRLALEWERIRHLHHAVARARTRLVAHGATEPEIERVEQGKSAPWKDIRSRHQEMRLRAREGDIAPETWERECLQHEFVTFAKRLKEHEEHWQQLKSSLQDGDYLVRLPNKEIAAFLRIPEGTIASRINTLKKKFLAEADGEKKS